MEWKRAGRPRVRPKEEEVQLDKSWTKDEQRMIKDPVLAIAAAVVRQWKKDGSPSSDYSGVSPWMAVIESIDGGIVWKR